MQCIAPLTNGKQVQSFIELISYYQDMWPRRTEITSKDVPFQWTDVAQQAFDKMKA
jgi:hypothetical protein